MRDDLDRFYTKSTVAKNCIDAVFSITNDFDIIVEPSAGGGSFSDLLPSCQAFDLAPTKNGIVQKDWLTVDKNYFKDYTNMLIIGNPPFGVRSVLAKNFIKHSIHSLEANMIAFILPRTFNKKITQKIFPSNWRLLKVISLDRGSSTFDLYGEEEIFIPCDFFIWTSRSDLMPGVDLRKTDVTKPEEIIFVPRGADIADFTINGNNGKVKELNEVTNPKAEHYIQVAPSYDIDEVKNFLKNLVYDFHSSVNGGVAWINKDDISEAFNRTKVLNNTVFKRVELVSDDDMVTG